MLREYGMPAIARASGEFAEKEGLLIHLKQSIGRAGSDGVLSYLRKRQAIKSPRQVFFLISSEDQPTSGRTF